MFANTFYKQSLMYDETKTNQTSKEINCMNTVVTKPFKSFFFGKLRKLLVIVLLHCFRSSW
jgi:hypothetical protein